MRDREKDRTSRRPPCGQTSVEQTDCFLWTVWRLDQSRLFKQQQLLGKVSQFRFQDFNVQKQNSKPLLSPSVSPSLSLPLSPCSAALGGNVFWKLALIGTSELEMTQTRPRAAPSGYSRCRRCQEALECRMRERDREREAVLPSDRIMSTSTHHTQTP